MVKDLSVTTHLPVLSYAISTNPDLSFLICKLEGIIDLPHGIALRSHCNNISQNSLEATVHYLCVTYNLKVLRKIRKFEMQENTDFGCGRIFRFIIRLRNNNRFLSLVWSPG